LPNRFIFRGYVRSIHFMHLCHMNALRAFEVARRLGRMSSAASELHVTPGAVSRQVRQLEEAPGVPLFEGPKNKPMLTPAGKLLQTAMARRSRSSEQAAGLFCDWLQVQARKMPQPSARAGRRRGRSEATAAAD
jgi:DNA-binding transcriptional LysR family regulator